jgi:FtsH-binding integral membrane protein
MWQRSDQQQRKEDATPADAAEIRFVTLLYRYLFYDWLFADMTKVSNLFERHSAWQHNRDMRRHLLTYLRRWSVLTVFAFGLGCLFEQMLKPSVMAACFFTWSCIMLTGMLVTSVMWVFLANPEVS